MSTPEFDYARVYLYRTLSTNGDFTSFEVSTDPNKDGGLGFGVPTKRLPSGFAPPVGAVLRMYQDRPGSFLGGKVRGVMWEKEDELVGYVLTRAEAAAEDAAAKQEASDWLAAQRAKGIPPTGHPKYEWAADMGEISGMGGGYEGMCRKMVAAGLQWLDDHPDANPEFQGFQGIYGVIRETNADAEALTAAVAVPTGGDYTGAMHQATIGTCLYIKAHGWETYCAKMREAATEKRA